MIIGLSGLAGSGKSTVARFLVKKHCFEEIALADPMKTFCREVLGFSREQLWGSSSLRNAIDPRFGKSPRDALQSLGTDWGRAFYENVWVEYAIRRALALQTAISGGGVVISDVRFKNERDAIRKAGGRVWRIIRPGAGLVGANAAHASENDLTDEMAYDRVVANGDGELDELEKLVARAVGGAP